MCCYGWLYPYAVHSVAHYTHAMHCCYGWLYLCAVYSIAHYTCYVLLLWVTCSIQCCTLCTCYVLLLLLTTHVGSVTASFKLYRRTLPTTQLHTDTQWKWAASLVALTQRQLSGTFSPQFFFFFSFFRKLFFPRPPNLYHHSSPSFKHPGPPSPQPSNLCLEFLRSIIYFFNVHVMVACPGAESKAHTSTLYIISRIRQQPLTAFSSIIILQWTEINNLALYDSAWAVVLKNCLMTQKYIPQ